MATQLQAGITTHDGVADFTRAMASNVTAGSLIVVSAARWKSGDATAYIAGNLTKSAGTATIDTPVLEYTASPGSSHRVGQWSVLVTGGGSLTLQVANGGTSYGSIAAAEYSGTWGSGRTEGSASGTGTSQNAASGNANSAGAAVFIGSMTTNSPNVETLTEDGAFALLGEDEDASARIHHSMIQLIVATGTTDSADWTIEALNTWVAGVVVYKETAAGPGPGSGSDTSLVGMSESSSNLIRVSIIEETS